MLDAVLKEWLNAWFRRPRNVNDDFGVKSGDFVSMFVYDEGDIPGSGVFAGHLMGPVVMSDFPAIGQTNHRLFIRLPNGGVFYADMMKKRHVIYDENWPWRYFIERQDDTYLSGRFEARRPPENVFKSVLTAKLIPRHPSVFYMWSDLGHHRGEVPDWAEFKSRSL